MNYETILVAKEPPLTTISLNRAEKRNALNPRLVGELTEAFAAAEKDAQCRVVILRAEGKAFSAGLDLDSLQKNEDGYFFDGEENILYLKVKAEKEINVMYID